MGCWWRIFGILLCSVGIAHASIWQVEVGSGQKGALGGGNVQVFSNDSLAMRSFFDQIPQQHTGQSLQIALPMPDGTFENYQIFESSIMTTELANKFPQIKSYKVQGIDDPNASGRVDMSQKGFRAMLYTAHGRVFIDPIGLSAPRPLYASRSSQSVTPSSSFSCDAHVLEGEQSYLPARKIVTGNRLAGSLLKYRLAVAATHEYVTTVNDNGAGNELSDAMAEINTAINRVNVIYQRDLGVELMLVANNDLVIDINGTSDLAGLNNFPFSLLPKNQLWLDSQLGIGTYDIGHVFSTGLGGVAIFRSACGDSTGANGNGVSGRGVTGWPNPTGDMFYIDFVAHEIGHQFGAEHSFNGTEGSCGSNRSFGGLSSFEPGSGSTIMGYANICGAENIQSFSDSTFHAGTIQQINAFVNGDGNCGVGSVIIPVNSEPTVSAGANYTIPKGTAFRLRGTGSDPDSDAITYQWDQMDAGTATDANTLGLDLGDNALFRSYIPQNSNQRDFPALGTQVDGLKDLSEALPCEARDLNFRVTVRDGRSGQATDDVRLTVDETAGPFVITSQLQAETIFVNSGAVTVQWDVANTNNATVACDNVDIDLLTFASDHATYAVTSLKVLTQNDGGDLVTIPDMSASQARFRVSCSNNIFYDISDEDLRIQSSGGEESFDTTGNDTFFNADGQTFVEKGAECDFTVTDTADPSSISDGGGGGMTNGLVLAFLGLLMTIVSRRRYYSR